MAHKIVDQSNLMCSTKFRVQAQALEDWFIEEKIYNVIYQTKSMWNIG
jgi:hypothetical protein